ncbi:hypothetical protein LOD99_12744 [Oopsacas minuta]|uniref:Uncharacterized protein n=1 Tax=Oopsacas minuta TaxID=111878 RepID=A0AAV7JCY9_9METZ|nr:hypothetical protein LOD99_12744 [Oopsacas minuta]
MAESSPLSEFLSDKLITTSGYSLFGRIMSWSRDSYPSELSQARITTFLFGEDAIRQVQDRVLSDPFGVLIELGLMPDYVKWKIEVTQEDYWLVLFRVMPSYHSPIRAFPATWNGIGDIIAYKFPGALYDFNQHKDVLSSNSCQFFEKESGIDFMKCLKLKQEDNDISPYFSYARFMRCPVPRSSWQVRLFLYCELRVLEYFTGDGYTHTADKKRGYKEYIANSINLSLIPADQLFVIKLHITPEHLSFYCDS